MNRGSAAARTRDGKAPACFNEAPIHESGKLQHLELNVDELAASMRPRFMNRGSILWSSHHAL